MLSLILWALILVVTCKYVLILLGHNKAKAARCRRWRWRKGARPGPHPLHHDAARHDRRRAFYGDADHARHLVLSVEGLEVGAPQLQNMWCRCRDHPGRLFTVQSRGTARVAAFFGPVMTLWFTSIAAVGIVHIADEPGVIAALNPMRGALPRQPRLYRSRGARRGSCRHRRRGAYADLGHFGRKPIQTAWLSISCCRRSS